MNILERLGGPGGRRGIGLLALGAVLVVFAACQLVAGVQSRSLDPILSGCTLPKGNGPLVRFADLAPTADAVDVCIRAAGGSWGEPILLNGGTGCTTPFPKTGFTYGQITMAFSAPAASVDIKTVPGGSACTATPLAELDGAALASGGTVTTLMQIGGAVKQPLKLVALPEFTSTAANALIRPVNAMPGVAQLDIGSASNAGGTHALPSDLTAIFTVSGPIAYGGTASKGQRGPFGAVEDSGYFPMFNTTLDLSGAAHGDKNALFIFPSYHVPTQNLTLYAMGVENSNAYPQQALLCDEAPATATSGNALLLGCLASTLPTLSFDVFNPALFGLNAPDFQNRERVLIDQIQNVPSPIKGRNSDVMCVVEVDAAADQAGIIAAAKAGGFNYSYTITTQADTQPSNGGLTQDGGACPSTIMPPCAGVDMASVIEPGVSCVEANCCDQNNDNGKLVQSTDCIGNNCLSKLALLDIPYPSCFNCIFDYFASGSTIGASVNACTTTPARPVAYAGTNSSMILSRYPISNTDRYILPSSYYRRSVLYGQVAFPGNVNVDVYCGFLITPLIGSTFQYDGCYGNGQTDSQKEYEQENLWQAKLMAQWVKSKSAGNRAVILGDWRSGYAGTPDAGTGSFPPPNPLAQATMDYLTGPAGPDGAGWTPAVGKNWPGAGQCNYCPGTVNALNGSDSSSYFTVQPFLYNWPGNNSVVLDEQLIYTDNVLLYGDAGTTANAPVSSYYGLNIHILRQ